MKRRVHTITMILVLSFVVFMFTLYDAHAYVCTVPRASCVNDQFSLDTMLTYFGKVYNNCQGTTTRSATGECGDASGWCGGIDNCCHAYYCDGTFLQSYGNIPRYQLSVQRNGLGTVTSSNSLPNSANIPQNNINCGSTCNRLFLDRTFVTLTANPASGYVFSHWGGACSGASSTCTIQMNQVRSVTATFGEVCTPSCPDSSNICPADAVDDGCGGICPATKEVIDCDGNWVDVEITEDLVNAVFSVNESFVPFIVDSSTPNFRMQIFDVTVFNNSCGLGCEYNHLENRCRFFIDNDNDDFGTVLSNNWVYGCGLTDGFALTGGDCNDNNPQIHPLAPEICDLQDNNCDNLIDTESDPNLTCTTKPGDLPVQNTATNVDLTFNRPYDPTLDYFYISWARIVGGLVYDGTASNRPVTNRILISLNYGETVRIRYRVHAPGPFNSLSVFYAYVNQITNGELQRVARSRNIEVHIVE